ncbi:MAG: nicotinamide riboside transporter PnuC [Firmicutes bacterium]|nr:nicotinamide riboside transporter PnuC [Bacillota bacterium]
MKFSIKKHFSDWTVFDYCIIAFSVLSIGTTLIFFGGDIFAGITSFIGILCAFYLAKGKLLGKVLGIAICITYCILSYNNQFYGEVLIYAVAYFPLFVYGIYEWVKHRNKKTGIVIERKLSEVEWLVIALSQGVFFAGIYFLLEAFGTALLLISTLSVVSGTFAIYLLSRRNRYGFLMQIINDIIIGVLWLIPILAGNLALLPIFLNPVINQVNDIMGIVNWAKVNRNVVYEDDIAYRRLAGFDKKKVFGLIDEMNSELGNPELFVPYSELEKQNLFNENYGIAVGAFDKERIIGFSELCTNQKFLEEYKVLMDMPLERVAQISLNLNLLLNKRGHVMLKLIKEQILNAKAKELSTVIMMLHPSLQSEQKVLEKAGFSYVKTATLENGFERKFFVMSV